jgi:hypothetical protein
MPVVRATGIVSGRGTVGGTAVGFYTHIRFALADFTGGTMTVDLL